ncbi:aminoglycoside phosphotransferase family protein [Micromonospora halotolerans]|uniref:Aminoglycoside phosphotransferase family protein n=1 Tax=Micromonospora halotolerans TaxID=709879 RepID=A0ABY9ZU47_9ACTN|nr:aminoglycoside phosphotransferase family protein [Micromonospora halotolerans]WNM38705.1 aminoglycoside phosphotransferase family protein [Micromonospora halotolerans]
MIFAFPPVPDAGERPGKPLVAAPRLGPWRTSTNNSYAGSSPRSSHAGRTCRSRRWTGRGGTTGRSASEATSSCGCPAPRATRPASPRRSAACRRWPATCRCPCPNRSPPGRPGAGYPYPWSVRRWLPGETVEAAAQVDRSGLARDLGAFLTALRRAPATGGPVAGRHSCFRGCHPSVYGDEVENALDVLRGRVDTAACRDVWARALVSAWPGPSVWFHGDVAVGNLLVSGGRLSAVIDFGTCGVGDPACDLVPAWTWFAGPERQLFRKAAGLPDDVWRRARGWALWKALIQLARPGDRHEEQVRILASVLADPVVG